MKRMHTIMLAIAVICEMLPQEISCSVNLAFKKDSKQSSWKSSGHNPFRAVDGRTESCSSTNDKLAGWHWFQVDLVGTYSVRYVNITNRADCCESSLQDFSIEISEEKPSTLPGFPQTTNASVCMTHKGPVPFQSLVTYECNQPVEGRYVRLVKESPMNSPIMICELEVYGNSIGPPNIALGKPAKQSSINYAHAPFGFANKAVDGDLNNHYIYDSCTHTKLFDYWHWWQVDLQQTYNISAVRITNRGDCCSDRLRNFTIEISEEEPSNLPGFPQTTNAAVCLIHKDMIPSLRPVMLECNQPVKGRYLRIVKMGPSSLSMCEVEVFESPMKPTKATEKELTNGKSGLWRFIYIASQGSMDVLTSSALTRRMIDCARQRISRDRTNLYVDPYIHIDLHTGTCRFFEYAPDRFAQPSSNWVMYKLE